MGLPSQADRNKQDYPKDIRIMSLDEDATDNATIYPAAEERMVME